jgi:glutamate racemase
LKTSLPIGVFDSGLGGLTIVKALRKLLPGEAIIYFGDTAHLPYGDKSPELVQGYSLQIADFLLAQPVKALVIACNTASALAQETIAARAGDTPVFDVIRPAVQEALRRSQQGKIGIIGTKATIHSGVYKQLLLSQQAGLQVIEKATPLLVPMIEEGWLRNRVSQDVIDAYLSDTGFQTIDSLILGCTHYPLIKHQIELYFQKTYDHAVEVVDSSLAVARQVKEGLTARNLLTTHTNPTQHYYVSDYTPDFQEATKLFLSQEVKLEKVEL